MKNFLYALLALAAIAAGIATQRFLQQSAASASLEIAFPDLQGKPHLVSEWKGRILIVNFWATWCPPCVEEMPEFVKLQNELGPRGVQFVGILTDDDTEAAREFLKSRPVNYPILDGTVGGREWSSKLGDKAGVLPFSVLFDARGTAIHAEAGRFTREEVLEKVEALLK